jgi:hypothetical protein
MTYSFPDLNPKDQSLNTHQEDLLMSSSDVLIDKSEQTRYTCRYPNLEYIDKSTSLFDISIYSNCGKDFRQLTTSCGIRLYPLSESKNVRRFGYVE